jgi:sugar lactone lactonase YvrE
VSRLDDELGQALRTAAADITPDDRDLQVVRERSIAVRRRQRRAALLSALVAVGIVVGAVLVGLAHRPAREPEPVGPRPTKTPPSPGTLRQLTNPFAVLRTIDGEAVGIDRPLRVAVAPDGHVYISDRSQHITELTPTGQVVRRWGGPGTAPSKFRLYSGALTVAPDGRVYVADTGNFRVQVFTSTGRFVAQYGGYGRGPGQFVWPSDVIVGRDRTMYVADDRAATITELSPTGRQLWRRGTPAEVDPTLLGHEHLGGLTTHGQLVTANDDVGKVLYLGRGGRVVDDFSTDRAGAGVDAKGVPGDHFPNGACGATIDPRGNVYVSSCEESYAPRHDTAVYDPRHRLVAGWKRGILVDSPVFAPNGRAWAVTSGNRAIVELQVHRASQSVTSP